MILDAEQATKTAEPADEEPHPEPRAERRREPSVEAWLVESGFARRENGELVATAAGRDVATAIF
jgi:hypothetical protein